jgi:uncharacterized protein (TIGR02757 family)
MDDTKLMDDDRLRAFLDEQVAVYNQPGFVENDPISVPHRFTARPDIEIMGFWAAVLAWGQRPTIIKKANELVMLMDGAPYDFVRNHQDSDLTRFLSFKHRTFTPTDTLYFLHFFQHYYQENDTLETAFLPLDPEPGVWPNPVEAGLRAFHDRFCCDPFFPERTRKHIATPERGSTCKRLLMFLRWMVRRDPAGVDFGLWQGIRPDQLLMPVDVHVARVARALGLLTRPQTDWRATLELTNRLRLFDPADPVRYDFALFGLGVSGSWPSVIGH